MTLNLENYEKFIKSQETINNIKKKGRPISKGSKYIIPEFLRDKNDYPCHYYCGMCKSNLYLRHPSNYIQHTKTKKHLKNLNQING